MTKYYIVFSLVLSVMVCFSGCKSKPEPKKEKKQTEEKAPDRDKIRKTKYKVDFGEKNAPDLTDEFGGRDPLEGFNRSMFHVNKAGHKYVVQPITTFWGSIIPRHVVKCFNRFTENIGFPKRMFSSFCQAKFKGGGIVFLRFLTNTTVGIAGLYDPADNWFELEPQDEDFGQAFASWGIGPGAYVHLPALGPTNIRDGIGTIFDYAFDPKTYIYGGQGFTALNKHTTSYRDIDVFMRSTGDPYELSKRLYNAQRYVKINDLDKRENIRKEQEKLVREYHDKLVQMKKDGQLPPDTKITSPRMKTIKVVDFDSQGSEVDTLRVGQFDIQNDKESMWVDVAVWNSDFYYSGSVRSVKVIRNKPDMPYKVWFQKDNKSAPLAVILPGTGAHYSNYESTALAEMLHKEGFTTVIISSSLNWEFMETAASVLVPGFVPRDSVDVRNAIVKVIEDLQKNKKCVFPTKVITGYSMGGMQAMFIADQEKKLPPEKRINFDRYISINPPVDLLYAIKQVDKCTLAWKNWARNEVFRRIVFAGSKYWGISSKKHTPFDQLAKDKSKVDKDKKVAKTSNKKDKTIAQTDNNKKVAKTPGKKNKSESTSSNKSKAVAGTNGKLPFDPIEAKVLIGYAFKITLSEIILTIHCQKNLGILKSKYSWGNRNDFYREVEQFTFMKFANTFLVKYYSQLRKHKVTVKQLGKEANLYAIGKTLKNSNNIYVIHTANDFLESTSDKEWLAKTMGKKCLFFEAGGHLGNLYFQKARTEFAAMVKPVVELAHKKMKKNNGNNKKPAAAATKVIPRAASSKG